MSAMSRRSFLLLVISVAATGCVSTGSQGKSPTRKEENPSDADDSEHLDSSSERHQAHLRKRRKARQLRLKKSRKRRLEAARKRRRRLKAARDRRRRRRT